VSLRFSEISLEGADAGYRLNWNKLIEGLSGRETRCAKTVQRNGKTSMAATTVVYI